MLSDAQTNEIDFVIDNFFEDFPFNLHDTLIKIAELKHILLSKVSPDKNHYFYWLSECFIHPTTTFRLQKLSVNAITIGDVQVYILNRIFEQIKKLANQFNVAIDKFDWAQDKLMQTIIPKEHFSTTFINKPAAIDGIEPELPSDMQTIYSYSIELIPNDGDDEEITFTTYTQVSVKLNNNIIKEKIILLEKTPSLTSDREEDQYLQKIAGNANECAENFATIVALDELPKTEDRIHILHSESAKKIISFRYYFNLLKESKIFLSQLKNLPAHAGDILTDPIIIKLIKKNICGFNDAIKLTPQQKLIVTHPVYMGLITNHKILISKILMLSDNRCKFLEKTLIANLIKKDKLPFLAALRIPVALGKIISHPFFINFFSQTVINWHDFSKIKPYQHSLILNKEFSSLIVNKIIGFEKIASLTKTAVILLESMPRFIFYLKIQLISPDELNINDSKEEILKLYLHIHNKRLKALYEGNPYFLIDTADNFSLLLEELTVLAENFNKDVAVLKQAFFHKYLMLIKNDIADDYQKIRFFKMLYFNILQNPEKNHKTDWHDKYEEIIHEVNKFYHQSIYTNPSPFLDNTNPTSLLTSSRLKRFCENLLYIDGTTLNEEEKNIKKIKFSQLG